MEPFPRATNPSLTKFYKLHDLVGEIAQLSSGMPWRPPDTQQPGSPTLPSVESTLASHPELADDLFPYDEHDELIEDTLVKACQQSDPAARLLVWTALLLADARLREVVSEHLTQPSGRLDPAHFSAASLRPAMQSALGGGDPDKASSNTLRWMEQVGIAQGRRHGSTIVALDTEKPTAFAVPAVIELITERAAHRAGFIAAPDAQARAGLALALRANHWLNLTADEFRAAAEPAPPPSAVQARPALPQELVQLDSELRRKKQAVLQGPPGVGKTHLLRGYLDWFAAPSQTAARLTTIAASVPANERTPKRIAQAVRAAGLPGIWEIVQFHPSYSYERFVRGLQPVPVPGGVTFKPVDRTIALIAAVARELGPHGDYEALLLIDEINRGDTAKLFGELLYALEYRGEPVSTPYEIDGDASLVVPSNLLLLGTMNTADQSIAMVDKALRRRFAWVSLRPDPTVIDAIPGYAGDADRAAARRLFDRVAALFAGGGPELERLQVGHSYFLPAASAAANVQESINTLAAQFAFDAWPLLEEYEAEGLLDPGALDALLAELGWSGSARPDDQRQLAAAIASWMSPSPPTTV